MDRFRDWAQLWLGDVAVRTRSTVEPSDVDKLEEYWDSIGKGNSTHLQLLDHMRGLVLQYQARGAP